MEDILPHIKYWRHFTFFIFSYLLLFWAKLLFVNKGKVRRNQKSRQNVRTYGQRKTDRRVTYKARLT